MQHNEKEDLSALVRYYIRRTDQKLHDIEKKLEQLISYRKFLLGASAVVSALMSILLMYLFGGK